MYDGHKYKVVVGELFPSSTSVDRGYLILPMSHCVHALTAYKPVNTTYFIYNLLFKRLLGLIYHY